MQRSVLAMIVLIGLLMGAAGFSLLLFRGGGADEPAAAIPASAEAALLIPSVPALLKDLALTRMAPAPGESGWDVLSQIISPLLEARAITFEPDPGWLSRSLRGGAVLAWIPSERADAPAHLVLAFEMPSRQEQFLSMVEQTILPELGSPGVVWKLRSHRGHAYGTIRFPGASEIVCVSSYRRLALITISGEAMRQSLAALTRRDASLLANPFYRRIRGDLRERSDLIAFVSGSLLKRYLGAPVAAEGARPAIWLRPLLALGSIQGVGVSITVGRRGQFRERVRVLASGVSGTLPGHVFEGRPSRITTAPLLPPGYPLYLGASFSGPEAAWARLPEVMADATGQDAAHVRERLHGIEEFLGLDIGKDLLGVIGDEAAVALDPGNEGSFLLALRPSDLQGARRLLGRLDGLARAAEAYRSQEASETVITTYEHPRLAPRRPSYAFVDSALLVADSPEGILRALETVGSESREGREAGLSGMRMEAGRAHLVAVAETAHLIEWLRGLTRGSVERGQGGAWLRRLQDLLPGAAGPLPASAARFRVTRDGLTGEWSAPVSPVILAALLLASPGERPSPGASLPQPDDEDLPAEPVPAAPTPSP